jgi:hypothetical protein
LITHVSPLGSMDMLSQLEVDMLKRTASSVNIEIFKTGQELLAVIGQAPRVEHSKRAVAKQLREAGTDQPAGRRLR